MTTLPYLHYIILTRDFRLFTKFCGYLEKRKINLNLAKHDLLTGFTPLHYAIFADNKAAYEFLIDSDVDFDSQDEFGGSPAEYLKLLEMVPLNNQAGNIRSVKMYFPEAAEIKSVEANDLIKKFAVERLSDDVYCTRDYIKEILFSGIRIEKDNVFRKQYLKFITPRTTQEEDELAQTRLALILGFISDKIGYGLFAGKDYAPGDFVARYGGRFQAEDIVNNDNTSYAVMSNVENVLCNGLYSRSLAAFINHSAANPNVVLQCIFHAGIERPIVTASRAIKRGEQFFLDYKDAYWNNDADDAIANGTAIGDHSKVDKITEMSNTTLYPAKIPEPQFV
eukprot:TRINITY_DN3108_c0_g1_i2.p2 TRINITY_DN3108_c0_g1~~TRINITY_DN3108_c0_g1_i2.p2  ORF type:complete len:337 (-),score=60.15 TRINITY_DN3108_c0_g1_i2:1070-2080(-)